MRVLAESRIVDDDDDEVVVAADATVDDDDDVAAAAGDGAAVDAPMDAVDAPVDEATLRNIRYARLHHAARCCVYSHATSVSPG